MGDNGLYDDEDETKNVELRFSVGYKTKWGEVVVLTGSRGLLGSGDLDKGIKLRCVHGHDGLSWHGSVIVPPGYECSYQYVVYNEHTGTVVLRETTPHELSIPRSAAGSCIMLADTFHVRLYLSIPAAMRSLLHTRCGGKMITCFCVGPHF